MSAVQFASLLFLYIFLPLTLAAYFLMPDTRRKNLVLIGVSLLFYAMAEPILVLLLAALTYGNYLFSLRIRPREPVSFWLPVAVNGAVLFLFRYADFLLSMVGLGGEGGVLLTLVNKAVALLNEAGFSLREVQSLMPLGLPFYFLTMVSFFADLYRGKVKPERDLINFAVYALLFPKLAQGPIVRYEQMHKQLAARKVNSRRIFEGSVRFVTGLSKKVLLADFCARTIASMAGTGDQTLVGAWLCAILYMYRIYFDFSGFCDMAIGLGRIFGFRLPENFRYPYDVVSVTEFTQRWNLTLRSFVKDYVYIPLGGNRSGQIRQVVNCMAAWLVVGLWHGAGLNYLVWALYLFVAVMMEKLLESQLVDLPRILRRFLTKLSLLFGWVLFAHPDLMELGGALKGMLGFGGFSAPGVGRKLLNSIPLILMCMLASSRIPAEIGSFWRNLCGMTGRARKDDRILATKVVYAASLLIYLCLMLWLCTVSLASFGEVAPVFGGR